MPGMISTRVLMGPLALGSQLGFDVGELLREIGCEPSIIGEPDGWVPLRTARDLFGLLESRSGDSAVGLTASRCVDPQTFDIFRYGGSSSTSMRSALEAFTRFFRILNTHARASISVSGNLLRLACSSGPIGETGHHAADFVLSCVLFGFQDIVVEPLVPQAIELRRDAPADPARYDRHFGCPTRFGASEDAIVFSKEILACSTKRPDPNLNALLHRHLAELEKRIPHADDLLGEIEHLVMQELSTGRLTLDVIALRLRTSRRSLQRRLESEGTSFREIIERIRQRLAESYLKTSTATIADIAYLLGYANVGAFHRAFVGWLGVSPSVYRERLSRPRV
jgi:AraC-like DNA-binding protein